MANFDTPPGLTGVGSPCLWHLHSVGTSFETANVLTRVAPPRLRSVTQERFQLSRVALRRHRSVLPEAHQHFDFTWSSLHPCRRTSCQPIHTTSTFKLDSIASELIEDLSTSTSERDDIASVAHLSHRDGRPLQSIVLRCNLKVTCHVDTVSCAQADCRVAGRRELMSCG